jgi:hypothetical protein
MSLILANLLTESGGGYPHKGPEELNRQRAL